ncbi:MAG: hypothetical protein HQM10_07290 [Candidatus Riflebacteria bacterium]|nr:hypothetical protein [Candidatus Riflebacteria bacterium]
MKNSEWKPVWSDYSASLLDFIAFIKERYPLFDSNHSPFGPDKDEEQDDIF